MKIYNDLYAFRQKLIHKTYLNQITSGIVTIFLKMSWSSTESLFENTKTLIDNKVQALLQIIPFLIFICRSRFLKPTTTLRLHYHYWKMLSLLTIILKENHKK